MRTRARLCRALLLSGAACVVIATSVAARFEPRRHKIDEVPVAAISGRVTIEIASTPDSGDLEAPFAVIARLHGASKNSQWFAIEIDGTEVCRPTVAGGASQRVDCASSSRWTGTGHHTVVVASAASNWTLDYLEVATHHGATRNYDLIVLPAQSHRYERVDVIWIGFAWFALTVLLLAPNPLPRRGGMVALYRVGATVVMLFLALVFLSRFVSPYVVLLSPWGFVACLGVLVAPHLWSVSRTASRRVRETGWSRAASATCALLFVLTAFGSVLGDRLVNGYHGNYSGFLHIARQRFDRNPLLKDRDEVRRNLLLENGGGYDGQFFYYEAYDPFLWRYRGRPSEYRAVVDSPPYRFWTHWIQLADERVLGQPVGMVSVDHGLVGVLVTDRVRDAARSSGGRRGPHAFGGRTRRPRSGLLAIPAIQPAGTDRCRDAARRLSLRVTPLVVSSRTPVCLVTLDPGDRHSVRADRGRGGAHVRTASGYRSSLDGFARRHRAVETLRGVDTGQ